MTGLRTASVGVVAPGLGCDLSPVGAAAAEPLPHRGGVDI